MGAGVRNFLSTPDLPIDTKGTRFMTPGGYIGEGDVSSYRPIEKFGDTYFTDGVAESVRHAWFTYNRGGKALQPWKGETTPAYTDFQDQGKYTWVKAPTFYGKPAQVGPVAGVLAGLAVNDKTTLACLGRFNKAFHSATGGDLPRSALNSTMGRHAARAIRACIAYEHLGANWQMLIDNIGRGDTLTCNPPSFPKHEIVGVGQHEAPRGLLSHWVVIEDERVVNYQAVVPSTWLAAPRNDRDEPASYDVALQGTPVADSNRPLEVLRTIHSFDPCMACAVHLTDTVHNTAVTVAAL
jgi:hydrogenase large subunit